MELAVLLLEFFIASVAMVHNVITYYTKSLRYQSNNFFKNYSSFIVIIRVADPRSFHPDPDTDPDPIRIQGFNDQKLKKKITAEKN
jgi:hypothetical protein